MTGLHVPFVASLLDNPQAGAEIGVCRGQFTQYFLATFESLHMYAVDAWRLRPPMDREGYQTYEGWPLDSMREMFHQRTKLFADRLTVLHMDSVKAANHVPDGTLDFVFIDAEHTYEGVSADIALWLSLIHI